eukprot:GHRR01005933.1.p1 GENE.GHRR01005933.1~~GHRR01005933.1.p1  ORF type:complete len:866 (+),score=436.33 GHRR01005933.1:2331-4928(+)
MYLWQRHQQFQDAANDMVGHRPWEAVNGFEGHAQQQEWQQQQQQLQCQHPQQGQQQQQQQVWLAGGQQQQPSPAGDTHGQASSGEVTPKDDVVGQQQLGADVAARQATAAHTHAVLAAAAETAPAAAREKVNKDGCSGSCLPHAAAPSVFPSIKPPTLKLAETCTVVGLDFLMQGDQTLPLLTLQLSAPAGHCSSSCTDGATAPGLFDGAGVFQAMLPAPSTGHGQFVVLQQQFEAGKQRQWHVGDRVQRFYSGTCECGTIAAVRNCSDTAAQACSQQYQKYSVAWDNAGLQGAAGHALAASQPGAPPATASTAADTGDPQVSAADPAATAAGKGGSAGADGTAVVAPAGTADAANHAASAAAATTARVATTVAADAQRKPPVGCGWFYPWELQAAGTPVDVVMAVQHATQITAEQAAYLLHTLQRLSVRPACKIFASAPEADQVYDTTEGPRAYNRIVPLPLGIQNIMERLKTGYYRSLQALLHDAALIASNAAAFNGAESKLAVKAWELYQHVTAAVAEVSAEQYPQQQQQIWLCEAAAGGLCNEAFAAASASLQQQLQDGLLEQEQHAATNGGGRQRQQRRSTAKQRPKQLGAGLPAASDGGGAGQQQQAPPTRRSRRHSQQHSQQRRQQPPRSRRSAAQKAMQVMAGITAEYEWQDAAADDDADPAPDEKPAWLATRPTQLSSRQRQQQQRYRDSGSESSEPEGLNSDGYGGDEQQPHRYKLRQRPQRQQTQQQDSAEVAWTCTGGLPVTGVHQPWQQAAGGCSKQAGDAAAAAALAAEQYEQQLQWPQHCPIGQHDEQQQGQLDAAAWQQWYCALAGGAAELSAGAGAALAASGAAATPGDGIRVQQAAVQEQQQQQQPW